MPIVTNFCIEDQSPYSNQSQVQDGTLQLWALRGNVKWIYDMHRQIHSDTSYLWLFLYALKNSFKQSNWATDDNPWGLIAALRYLPWVWTKPYQKIPRGVEYVVLIPNSQGSEAQFWFFHYTPLMISFPKTEIILITSRRLSRLSEGKWHFKMSYLSSL